MDLRNFVFGAVLFLLAFSLCSSLVKPSTMCSNGADCSFQFPNAKEGSCIIHQTAECLNFTNETTTCAKKVSPDTDSKFSVSVIPYAAGVHDLQHGIPLSAVNITIKLLQKGITSVSIKIFSKHSPNPMCRIIDFQNYTGTLNVPATIFYDCFYNLVEHGIQSTHMSFLAMPLNEELDYYVTIPSASMPDSACSWVPLIMIFCKSLEKGIIRVLFSQPPPYLNISAYVVNLIEQPNKHQKHSIQVAVNSKIPMMRTEFFSIATGNYTILVNPVINGIHCRGFESQVFFVQGSLFDMTTVICISAIFILTFLSGLIFIKIFRETSQKREFSGKKTVLLAFSDDCEKLENLATTFKKYLTIHCHLNVSTIFGTFGIPKQYLEKKYDISDIVIYIISEGLFHTLSPDSPHSVIQRHVWHHQLKDTQALVSSKPKDKKVCNVCFDFAGKEFMPECLKNERCFILPTQLNSMLCFIFDCKPVIPFCNIYPSLRGGNMINYAEGKRVQSCIEAMQSAVLEGTHVELKDNIPITETTDSLEEPSAEISSASGYLQMVQDYKKLHAQEGDGEDLNSLVQEWREEMSAKTSSATEDGELMEALIRDEYATSIDPN